MIIFFLGRQPEIGIAELSAVYRQTPALLGRQIAMLDIPASDVLAQASRLGSIVKIGEITHPDFIISKDSLNSLAEDLSAAASGKITLGVSYYGNRHATKASALNFGLELQSALRKHGNSVRLLPNSDAALSTATILHNGLSGANPKKVELNVIQQQNKHTVTIARTIFVQDINAYTFRDRRRPRRDARNGMLPPKLAQTMINLAHGAMKHTSASNTPLNLLDPFCGTGVVLQEATLMGMDVYGTDLNPDMINYTKDNLAWLNRTHRHNCQPNLAVGDATSFNWKAWAKPDRINLVATETYLGQPYTSTPPVNELKHNITACNIIISKFLQNISGQLPRGAGLCVGIPAWFIRDHIHHLPCAGQIDGYGFSNMTVGANLIYHRPDQIVGRELLVLQKR